MFKEICINSKPCEVMKSVCKPKYGSKTVLTDSCWEYVSLFLKRQSISGASDALFYWEQAHSFYLASESLPDNARPLTSYYCILNAAKALLRYKGIEDVKLNSHGISSVRDDTDKTNIKEAYTSIKGAGVLPELARYYKFSISTEHYSIFDLLYNIPCVHRAYCITFSKPEIFVPIFNPVFVKKENSKEAWLKFEVRGRYANKKALQSLKAIDIVTEKAKIPRKKALLGKNQVIVNEADLDKVEEEKKAVVMQMEIARQAEAKALKKSDDNWRYEAKLNAREAEISENEQYLQTKLRYADQLHTEAYEMYNRQRNINSILEQTERECRQYKSEAERVPYLEHQIEDMEKRLAELEKTCSEKENETAALNEKISEQKKENTALRKLYNSAYDIAEYACKKLKIDADRAIQKRSDGYRTTYIFGDEKKLSI